MNRRGAPSGAGLLALVVLAAGFWAAPTIAVGPSAGPSPAQPPSAAPAPPPPPPRILTLAGQSPFARPDGALQLTLLLSEPAEGLSLHVTVHRAVTSRTELTQALAGRGLGTVEGQLPLPVTDLATDEAGRRVLTLGVQGPLSATTLPEPTRIVPGRSGVYPTELQLLRGDSVIDRFVTPMVVIAPGLSPLTLAWIWRFDATPAHQPDGTIRPAAAEALGPSGRLVRLAQAAAASGVPLTLAPTPETLAAWQGAASREAQRPGGVPPNGATVGLSALRTAAASAGHQVLRSPFVPFDMPGLLEADLDSEIVAQFTRGEIDQREILGPVPSPPFSMLAPGPLDNTALGRLRQFGAERLVFPPEGLQPREQRLTPGRPFVVGSGKPYPAAITDPDLARLLEGDDPPALRATRFLAGLSLVALEAPGEPRGVVVVSPEDWDPPSPLLGAVLNGLVGNPAVVPTTLDGYFTMVKAEERDGRPMVRDLAVGRVSEAEDADEVRALRGRLAAFSGAVDPDSDWLDTADRMILLSRAEVLREGDRGEERLASSAGYLDGAEQFLDGIVSSVRGPRGQRVTLTSRRATIPISLLNASGRPIHVRIRLKSDQLRFLDGAERFVTLATQNTTEAFQVEARSTGAFPLEISVTSPDGTLQIDSSELTVRSTVVSGVGAVLTAGAGLFLLGWWGNDLRRSRRRRRGRRRDRIAAKAAARALDDAERVSAGTG